MLLDVSTQNVGTDADTASLTVAQEEVFDNIPCLGECFSKSFQFRVFCKQTCGESKGTATDLYRHRNTRQINHSMYKDRRKEQERNGLETGFNISQPRWLYQGEPDMQTDQQMLGQEIKTC